MDCPACDGLGQVARQRPNLPLGLAEQLVVLVSRPLGEELSGYRDAETEALQSGLVGHHAAGGRGKGAVRDATAIAAASTCSSVRSGFRVASGFMEALSAVAVGASNLTAFFTVQKVRRPLH